MLRHAVPVLLLLLLAPAAEASDAGDAAAIRDTISRQLDAFRRDDGAAAFAIAAPAIQRMFGDAEQFMAMVAQSYQPVYRSQRVTFRELVREGSEVVQKAVVTGPDGVPVVALYGMERDDAGAWRINGCVLLSPEESPT